MAIVIAAYVLPLELSLSMGEWMTDMVAVHYWSDMANLTHSSQIELFNFCACEEQEYFPYDDCPVM